MNLISQDYLIHYGVKGMKWGVRHDPRVEKARANYVQKRSEVKRKEWSNAGYRLSHPMGGIFGVGKSGLQDRKNEKELEVKRKDLDKAAEKYYNTKSLVKKEKTVSKYSSKAKSEADWARNTAKDINKNGDWEDKEFFNSLSPSEKKAEWARSRKVASQYMKDAKYWDKAVKDISNTKNKKEAKNLYKKYRNNAPYYGFGI